MVGVEFGVPGCESATTVAAVKSRAPVLTVYGASSYDVQLRGRGLRLYPSPLTAECLALDAPDRRPVLVYPCSEFPMDALADDLADTDALADLVGRTRASVLRALTSSATTTQLARRTGISLASASEHAQVLRNAGLLTTHRTNGTALHSLTPTAHRLLTTPGQIRADPICPTKTQTSPRISG